ncbi:hypothetical protein [uncultured Eubacterium sp.]|uniref:hypothetical protein n=1 Tax=uncultured Eubacterium sp. TaxID=165185 RepID=UPI000EEF486B|nr:hypothetical protein [uncultured Eubacterium sp.]HAH18526.1 hypothetical protein [Eubacterium sp.]
MAKAKVNAAQEILEMIEIASGKRLLEKNDDRHKRNAMFGWYLYDILDVKKQMTTYNENISVNIEMPFLCAIFTKKY